MLVNAAGWDTMIANTIVNCWFHAHVLGPNFCMFTNAQAKERKENQYEEDASKLKL